MMIRSVLQIARVAMICDFSFTESHEEHVLAVTPRAIQYDLDQYFSS